MRTSCDGWRGVSPARPGRLAAVIRKRRSAGRRRRRLGRRRDHVFVLWVRQRGRRARCPRREWEMGLGRGRRGRRGGRPERWRRWVPETIGGRAPPIARLWTLGFEDSQGLNGRTIAVLGRPAHEELAVRDISGSCRHFCVPLARRVRSNQRRMAATKVENDAQQSNIGYL